MKKLLCIIVSVLLLVSLTSCNVYEGTVYDKPIIAVETDSNELYAAKEYCLYNDAEIFEFSTFTDAVVAVENGKADFVVLDEFSASAVISAGSELEFYEETQFSMSFCAYFLTEDVQLCNDFNSAVKKLDRDGVIEAIVDAHKNGRVVSSTKSNGTKGELVMLCDPIFDNTLYYNSEGEIAGVDLDIAKEICSELGYTLVVKAVDFEDLFLSLENGEGDFIMSSMEYTPERAENYLASEIYNTLNYSLYKRK